MQVRFSWAYNLIYTFTKLILHMQIYFTLAMSLTLSQILPCTCKSFWHHFIFISTFTFTGVIFYYMYLYFYSSTWSVYFVHHCPPQPYTIWQGSTHAVKVPTKETFRTDSWQTDLLRASSRQRRQRQLQEGIPRAGLGQKIGPGIFWSRRPSTTYIYIYIYIRSLFCSPCLHLFYPKYSKSSNIVSNTAKTSEHHETNTHWRIFFRLFCKM